VEQKAIAAGENIRRQSFPWKYCRRDHNLEEKSLGCIYKAGTSPLEEVIPTHLTHEERVGLHGYPAHDIEQLTGMVAGGVQIVLFTTGRGHPWDHPSHGRQDYRNRDTYVKMKDNMDVDVSRILKGRKRQAQQETDFRRSPLVASGKVTKPKDKGRETSASSR